MSYSSEVLADSPIGYWRLGDASGTTCTDSSGNSHNLTYANSPTLGVASLLPGWLTDTAVTFNGTNQNASGAGTSAYNVTTYTVAAWIKTTGSSESIVTRYGATNATKIWDLAVTSTGKAQITIFNSAGTGFAAASVASVNDGLAHFVVGTRDASNNLAIYVDGVQATAAPSLTANADSTTNLVIASRSNSANFFTGTIDEVAFYGSVLTSSRVSALYKIGSPKMGVAAAPLGSVTGTTTGVDTTRYDLAIAALGPIASWKLNGGSTTETDYSGNGNTATWNSAPASATKLATALGTSSDLTAGTKYASANNLPVQASMSAVSVVAWFQTSTSGTYKEINTAATTSVSAWKWLLRIQSDNRVEWIVNINGSLQSSNGGFQVPFANVVDGLPHMYVGTYDGTTMYTYVDGVQVGGYSGSGSIPAIGAGSIVIGSRPDHSEIFSGYLDNQAIFNFALTPTQITNLYVTARAITGAASAVLGAVTADADGERFINYRAVYCYPESVNSATQVKVGIKLNGIVMTGVLVQSSTQVTIAPQGPLSISVTIPSSTAVQVRFRGTVAVALTVTSVTEVRIIDIPEFGDNDPILMSMNSTGNLVIIPPPPVDLSVAVSQLRTTSLVALSAATPAVINGRPYLPKNWAILNSTATAIEGPTHIHTIPDPTPVWDPTRGTYKNPPPSTSVGAFYARWSVGDLPDPAAYPNNYYWLGDPSSSDGTAHQSAATHLWHPSAATSHAPSWRSFYPFKPSVTSVDHYLQGGGVVHHPKGVNFNPHFIEHMWLDWGRDMHQPFTWLITGMVTGYPSPNYKHYIMDSGRDPDATGMSRLSASQTGTGRTIHDNLTYRNLLAVNYTRMIATSQQGGSATMNIAYNAHIRPKLYVMIFDGTKSIIGQLDTSTRHVVKGRITKTSAQHHRYWVMGRRYGHLDQLFASQMLIFDMRYWAKALTLDDVRKQYAQLSSSYHFDRYRGM